MIQQRSSEKSWKTSCLLAPVGLTPQIITETLYYFYILSRPRIFINKIIVLTTQEGKKRVERSLLRPKSGMFYRFCQDYEINPNSIEFSRESIVVLRDQKGNEIDDIRSQEDNLAVADQTINLINGLTEDSNTRLYCSMAGGRKTLGLFVGFAIQFYGRKQDTLCHVLVSPPELENHPKFFYPPLKDAILSTKIRKHLSTDKANITLAEVPFLRLRGKFQHETLKFPPSFTKAMRKIQKEMDIASPAPSMSIKHQGRAISCLSGTVILAPMAFCVYLYFVNRKSDHCSQKSRQLCEDCKDCFLRVDDLSGETEFPKLIPEYYSTFYSRESAQFERIEQAWKSNSAILENNLRSQISKINAALKRMFSAQDFEYARIQNLAKGKPAVYGIRIERSRLSLE